MVSVASPGMPNGVSAFMWDAIWCQWLQLACQILLDQNSVDCFVLGFFGREGGREVQSKWAKTENWSVTFLRQNGRFQNISIDLNLCYFI